MAKAGRENRGDSAPHKLWSARAADYRRLAGEANDPALRQVLDHLTQICAEMAKATDPSDERPPLQERWVHPNDVVRETTGHRWRIREAEYRAIAANCESDEGRKSWVALADRCASLAHYLEHV
jgi:hypothetical protein